MKVDNYCNLVVSMITKQKIKSLSSVLLPGLALLILLTTTLVFDGAYALTTTNKGCEVDTSIIDCNAVGNSVDETGNLQNSGLWSILILAIQILSAGVGVLALAGIVYGVVLYVTSQGEAAGIKKAIEVIRNVVIGIAAYALMWAGLNWLIPGGVFN